MLYTLQSQSQSNVLTTSSNFPTVVGVQSDRGHVVCASPGFTSNTHNRKQNPNEKNYMKTMTVIKHCRTDNWLIWLYFLHLGEENLSETLQKSKVWKTANNFGELEVSWRREGKRRSSLNCSAEAQERCYSLLICASRKWTLEDQGFNHGHLHNEFCFGLAFWNKALCSPNYSRIHYVAWAGLKLQAINPSASISPRIGITFRSHHAMLFCHFN